LFRPVGQAPERVPLVIQTNAGERLNSQLFTLYGGGGGAPATGPGLSIFLAQILSGRGIAVVHDILPVDNDLVRPTGGTRLDYNLPNFEAYESLAEHLVRIGIVDRERVGIAGFSNRAWHVQRMLAFSDFPFAAAVASDGINGGYLRAAISGWSSGQGLELNGAAPFGAGFEQWLENSPAFNVERFRAPLLLQRTGSVGGVAAPLFEWETFSRLRHLGLPVELYIAPQSESGSHTPQNPSQLLAVQQRTLDWWLYWLKDEVDPDPTKAQQYRAWNELRLQRNNARTVPRPPLLDWSATPRQ
jgi:hypothetical protein